MNKGLILKEFKDRRYYFIIGLIFAALSAFYTIYSYKAIFPQLLQTRQDFRFNYYLWNAWFGQGLWQLAMTFAVIMGATFISQEKKYNSMGFLLTRNITRRQLIISKLMSNLLIIIMVIVTSIIVLLYSPYQLGISYTFEMIFIGGSIFALLVAIFTFILTALFCIFFYDGIKALGAGMLWIFGNGFLYSKDAPSIINYMVDKNMYMDKGFPYIAAAVLLLATALLIFILIRIFKKKDFLD